MGLRKAAVRGTKWSFAASLSQVVVQLLRLSILTRFLEKSDFGLVAIVTLVLGFTRIFADLGVSVVLLSKTKISKQEYSSLYWYGLISAGILYGFLMLLSPLVAEFYNLEELTYLIPLMGIDLIISSAGRQFKIFRQKSLEFREIGFIEISSSICSLVVSVIFAIEGYGVYSLIYSVLLNSALSTFLYIITGMKSHPIGLHLNFRETKKIYRMGLFQSGSQVLDYFSNQLDVLLIGKLVGLSELGVYNLIKQFVLRPYGLINPVIVNVSIPVLAKLQTKQYALKNQFLKLLRLVSVVNFPVYGLLFLNAEMILRILYGPAYAPEAYIMKALCMWAVVTSFNSAASGLVVITGRTDKGFKWTLIRICTNPLFILGGSVWMIKGIVYGQIICVTLYLVLFWVVLVKRILPITLREYLKCYFENCFKAVIAISIAVLMQESLVVHEILKAILSSLTFALLYVLLNLELIKKRIKVATGEPV